MTCVEQYLVSIYMTSVLVSELSNPVVKNSRVECLTACFRNATCSTCFFDKQRSRCYLHNKWFENLDTSGTNRIYYFLLHPETCSSNGYRFVRRGSMCLKVSQDSLTWLMAKTACEYEGARLVKIDSEEKQNAIEELFAEEYSDSFHIGLSKNHTGDGTWRWTDNSVLVYNNWVPGSQRTLGAFVYLYVDDDGVSSYWEQIADDESLRYICEKP